MISDYLIHLGILLCIYIITNLGQNIAFGFTGLINLGHVAFVGIGAYTSAILATNGFPLWISIPIAAIVAGIFGVILALPTTRLKGDYLAVATLGFSFIGVSVSKNWVNLTRGPMGIPGIPKLFSNNLTIFIFLIIIVIIVYIALWLLTKSRIGKTFEAIRDDETSAKVLGKNTFFYKTLALAISAIVAGIAGGLLAHYILFIDPTIFSIPEIVWLLSILIVGGLASLPGSVIGAIVLYAIQEPLRFIITKPELVGPGREIIFALLLILILIYRPKGILGKVDLG